MHHKPSDGRALPGPAGKAYSFPTDPLVGKGVGSWEGEGEDGMRRGGRKWGKGSIMKKGDE